MIPKSCFAVAIGLSVDFHSAACLANQAPCSQPDVMAFVKQSRLAAPSYRASPHDARTTLCSAWVLARNPAWAPGNAQPAMIRVPQYFWVSTLQSGYEVGLLPPAQRR